MTTNEPAIIWRGHVRFVEVAARGDHLIMDAGPREPLPYGLFSTDCRLLARVESRVLADYLLSCLEAD